MYDMRRVSYLENMEIKRRIGNKLTVEFKQETDSAILPKFVAI